jgi:tetratricopeptide (TPR) repeat protein
MARVKEVKEGGGTGMWTKFKDRLSSINKIIYFDTNQFLREKTSDPVRLQAYIEEVNGLLERCLNEEDEYFLRGVAGNLNRIYGKPREAIDHLTFCLNYAKERQEFSKEIVSLIRLGEALKYSDQHSDALNNFNLAFEKCVDNNLVECLDFVYQHKGKCLLELARWEEAEECFLAALKLRQEKGDLELIQSTKQALDLLKYKSPES